MIWILRISNNCHKFKTSGKLRVHFSRNHKRSWNSSPSLTSSTLVWFQRLCFSGNSEFGTWMTFSIIILTKTLEFKSHVYKYIYIYSITYLYMPKLHVKWEQNHLTNERLGRKPSNRKVVSFFGYESGLWSQRKKAFNRWLK